LDAPIESLPASFERVSGPDQPPGTSTGITAIDETISAVLSGNASEVEALLDFKEQSCSVVPDAPDAVRCPDGVSDGSLVEVFVRDIYDADAAPIVRSVGELTVDEVVTLDILPPRLYAVVRQEDQAIQERNFSVLFSVFFSHRDGAGFAFKLDEAGRIVAALTGGASASELYHFATPAEVVLPPATPAQLHPPR
jgi:hypothetical protein